MNLGALIALTRNRVRDLKLPYKFSDSQMMDFANAAVHEALERARLKYDTTTAPIETISILANVRDYALDPSIQHIDVARVDTGTVDLLGFPIYRWLWFGTLQDIVDWYGDGWDNLAGFPVRGWRDEEGIHLVPRPTTATTMKLWVNRMELASEVMDDNADIPMIPARHHRDLVYWMLYECYSVHDADYGNPKKAADNYALFERAFGRRPSANLERQMLRRQGSGRAYNRRFGEV